jgi:hypothetical protein
MYAEERNHQNAKIILTLTLGSDFYREDPKRTEKTRQDPKRPEKTRKDSRKDSRKDPKRPKKTIKYPKRHSNYILYTHPI